MKWMQYINLVRDVRKALKDNEITRDEAEAIAAAILDILYS